MPLDPTPPTHGDHYEEQPYPDAAERAGSRDPMTGSGEEPIRKLLWTAATYRPLEEVAALVMLLKRTGEVPNPGDEALRVAAVARPIDEVMRLVALLNEPPHEIDEADTTLRAAAVGRPIEEVAQLVSYLGTHENEPHFGAAHRSPERGEPVPTLFDRPDEQDEHDPYQDPAEPADPAAHAARAPAARRVAPWTSAPAGPLPEVPRPAPTEGRRPTTGPAARTVSTALRSPLRWPAAAALLACGVIHLPTDFAGVRSGGYADAVSLVVTVFCLVFGVWLAAADSARIWAAGAATAVGIIAAHTLSGLGTVDLLRSSLGADFAWASLAALGCAAVALVLAGTVLTLRQKTAQKTAEKPARNTAQQASRRPSAARGVTNDA
ncbi:hypothetical protein ABZ353_19630 [Streptomyces niveus]|uniref:hypothetical protein n=1 Tax=Streptomyces niveus TaxID=193462 RepID=UPI0033D3831A